MHLYPTDTIIKCENAIFRQLQYNCLIPTSSEILKLILYVSNPGHDFTDIIQMSNELIFGTLLQNELSSYKYSSIALASLFCVLENLGYINFKNGIIDLIHELALPFDLVDID